MMSSWDKVAALSIECLRLKLQLSDEDVVRYRWRCSCGSSSSAHERIGSAVSGAAGHASAMRRQIA